MDILIEPAGSFGRFQKLNLFIVGCITSLSAMYYSLVILNYLEPEIKCKVIPGLSRNLTLFYTNKLKRETDMCNLWTNYTISFKESNEKQSVYVCYFNDTFNYGLNVVTEWNLVCKHRYLASVCQSLFLVGTLSAFVSEKVGSRFGRKKASTSFILCLIGSQIAFQALMTDFKLFTLKIAYRFILYSFVQFINGILVYCMGNSTYLILIDLTTANYQQAISKINVYFFLFGEMASLGLVYSVSNWRMVNICLTVLTALYFVLFSFLVPDSPRWCIESGRYDEAYEIMKRMARFNKKKSYDTLKYKEYAMKRFKSDSADLSKMPGYVIYEEDELEAEELRLDSDIIFRNKSCFPPSKCLRFFIIIAFFNCLSVNFFGISLSIVYVIPVNSYSMLLLSTLSGVMGTLVCNLNEKIGYRRALLSYIFTMGLSLTIVSALPYNIPLGEQRWFLILKGGIYLLAKSMIIAAYNTAIVIVSELFEIKLRLNAMLILNCVGCVATLFTPQINLLRCLVWKPLPFLVYAFWAFISFLISYHLPIAKSLQKKKKFDLSF